MPWLYTDAVVYSRGVNFQLFSWGLEGGEKYPGVILGGKFPNDLSNGELLHFNLVRVTSRSPVCPVEAGGRDYKSLLGHSNPTAAGPTEPPLSFPSRPPHLSLFSRPLYKDRKSDPPHPPPLPSRPQPSLSLSLFVSFTSLTVLRQTLYCDPQYLLRGLPRLQELVSQQTATRFCISAAIRRASSGVTCHIQP